MLLSARPQLSVADLHRTKGAAMRCDSAAGIAGAQRCDQRRRRLEGGGGAALWQSGARTRGDVGGEALPRCRGHGRPLAVDVYINSYSRH